MHRLPTVLDTVIVLISTASTGAANLMLANAPVNEINYYNELRLLLIPLIGAMLVSGGMIMLNPQPETRKIVIGRSIFSLFIASIAPQLLGYLHPAIQAVALRPVMLLAIGGATAGFVYAISRPFCAKLYENAARNAKFINDQLEKKLEAKFQAANVEREVITITKETPKKHEAEHEAEQK